MPNRRRARRRYARRITSWRTNVFGWFKWSMFLVAVLEGIAFVNFDLPWQLLLPIGAGILAGAIETYWSADTAPTRPPGSGPKIYREPVGHRTPREVPPLPRFGETRDSPRE